MKAQLSSNINISLSKKDVEALEAMDGETESDKVRALLQDFDQDQVKSYLTDSATAKRTQVRIDLDIAFKLRDAAEALNTDVSKVARAIMELKLHN